MMEKTDIVNELRMWAEIIDGLQGKPVKLTMLSGAVHAEAADEIERLRNLLDVRGDASEVVRFWSARGYRGHWHGCWKHHAFCAILLMAEENSKLRQQLHGDTNV